MIEKPKLQKRQESQQQELPLQPTQHIRIVDCNKPIRQIFYECYKCQQGLLTECDNADDAGKVEDIDGSDAIRSKPTSASNPASKPELL